MPESVEGEEKMGYLIRRRKTESLRLKQRHPSWHPRGIHPSPPPGIRQANGEMAKANLPSPRAIILLCMFESLREEKDL